MSDHLLRRLPDALLIDLDGTLVDSAPDLAFAVDAMLADLGREPAGETAVRRWVGNGVEKLVNRALTGHMDGIAEAGLLARALAVFNHHYASSNGRHASLYAGVGDTLAGLQAKGVMFACVTNKPSAFSEPLLATMGIAHFFTLLVSGDSLPRRKPDPLPLEHAMRELGTGIADTVAVGDSVSDVRAARAAHCPVVAVSYGYNHGRPIGDEQPDGVIDSFADLPAALLRLPVQA